jgi:hypothetical protein
MKIFWLTPGQLAAGLLVGAVIALIATSASVPHPVQVPVQVITPVPTPPPVVITAQPTPVPTAPVVIATYDLAGNPQFMVEQIIAAMQAMFYLIPLIVVLNVMYMILKFARID